MGLLARFVEENGIPTVCLGAALGLMQLVRPPRGVFVNFPLGRSAGGPEDAAVQRRIVGAALDALEGNRMPGQISVVPEEWDERGWAGWEADLAAAGC